MRRGEGIEHRTVNIEWYTTWRADGLGGHVGGVENDEVISLVSIDRPASEAAGPPEERMRPWGKHRVGTTWRADGLGGHVGGGENDGVFSLVSVDWQASEAAGPPEERDERPTSNATMREAQYIFK